MIINYAMSIYEFPISTCAIAYGKHSRNNSCQSLMAAVLPLAVCGFWYSWHCRCLRTNVCASLSTFARSLCSASRMRSSFSFIKAMSLFSWARRNSSGMVTPDLNVDRSLSTICLWVSMLSPVTHKHKPHVQFSCFTMKQLPDSIRQTVNNGLNCGCTFCTFL